MTNELILVKPTKALEQEILAYKQEYFDYGEPEVNGTCGLAYYKDFDAWLHLVRSIEHDQLRHGVHTSTYFSVRKSDHKIIGSLKLHHSLSPEIEDGGHIAYGIRPSERHKGYGRQQLELILEEAKKLNLTKVMIACKKENIASAKTAMSCGGILTCEKEYDGAVHQQYWINIRD